MRMQMNALPDLTRSTLSEHLVMSRSGARIMQVGQAPQAPRESRMSSQAEAKVFDKPCMRRIRACRHTHQRKRAERARRPLGIFLVTGAAATGGGKAVNAL